MSYLDTFNILTGAQIDCDQTQDLIDEARSVFPTAGFLQLELDRKQADLNAKREQLENIVAKIAFRN